MQENAHLHLTSSWSPADTFATNLDNHLPSAISNPVISNLRVTGRVETLIFFFRDLISWFRWWEYHSLYLIFSAWLPLNCFHKHIPPSTIIGSRVPLEIRARSQGDKSNLRLLLRFYGTLDGIYLSCASVPTKALCHSKIHKTTQ